MVQVANPQTPLIMTGVYSSGHRFGSCHKPTQANLKMNEEPQGALIISTKTSGPNEMKIECFVYTNS